MLSIRYAAPVQRRPPQPWRRLFTFAAIGLAIGCADTVELPAVAEGEWSLVVLPDTQIYAANFPDIFEAQGRWASQRPRKGSIFEASCMSATLSTTMGLRNGTLPAEAWSRFSARFRSCWYPEITTTAPAVPRIAAKRSCTPVFPLSEARTAAGPLKTAWTTYAVDNTYHLIDTPDGPWLLLGLEFAPRTAAVEWARQVLASHADVPTAVVTHAYLYSDNTRYDFAQFGDEQHWHPRSYGVGMTEGVQDGEELFNTLVHPADQVQFVFSGHVLNDGLGQLRSEQANGGEVHQLLANYQMNEFGGGGFLRILHFSNGGQRVQVSTYSPWLDERRRDSQNEFSLELSP